MRKMFVGGNWKMNGSLASIQSLLENILRSYPASATPEAVIFPPSIYLPEIAKLLKNTSIAWGGQNLSQYDQGAYTGEISADMLLDLGCLYVLVGHSERRQLFGESNEVIAHKFQQACKAQLKPVLCVGETKFERQSEQTYVIIENQLNAIFNLSLPSSLLQTMVIAYEPVWAIGTGLNASPEQAQAVHAFIRDYLKKYDENLAKVVRIIYGGSVKAGNVKQLCQMPDIDGALVGGASLNAQEFVEIINLCKH